MTTSTAPDDQVIGLREAWQAMKWNAPALLVMPVVLLAAVAPGIAVMVWFTPVGVALAVLLGLSTWAGCVRTAELALRDGDATVLVLLRSIARFAPLGLRTAWPPAFAATCFVTAWYGFTATENPWFLVPAAAAGSVTVVLAIALPFAVTLAAVTALRGKQLWMLAIGLVATHPSGALGVAAASGLAMLCATDVLFSLALLAPGPIAILSALATRQACARRGLTAAAWHE
ncbi:MAG: hypothetical protein QM628_13985 [Propionicimonas sp.]